MILHINVKILPASQIARFLSFNISKTIGGIKSVFSMYVHIY